MYPKNNREVVPKLHLRSEQNMETNPSTHPWAVEKIWTIQSRYGHSYAEIRIPPTVSILDRRRLTWLHRSMYDNGKEESSIIPRVVVETG